MEDVFIDLGDDLQIGNGDSFTIGEDNLLTESETLVGPQGPPGPPGRDGVDGQDGQAATITVGTTTTTSPGTDAIVTNVGDEQNAILNFSIPRGAQGERGETGETGPAGEDGFSPTVTVTETPTGYSLLITDADGTTGANLYNGVDGQDGAPGQAATISVGSTTTGAAGTNASVTNSGTTSAAVLDFVIPRGADGSDGSPGADGQAATIAVGTTTTGNPGTNASVTNSGTSSAAVFNFTIPRGADGAPGQDGSDGAPGADGQAATITVGSTTTGSAGTNASVTNSGTSSAAVLDFTIPRGADGAPGVDGSDGQDGFSPIATVTQNTGSATISITDENGTTTATVYDGSDAPVPNDGTLTIQRNGTNVQTFTANQSTNVTANITVPTRVTAYTIWSGNAYTVGDSIILNEELVEGNIYIWTVRGLSGAYIMEFPMTYRGKNFQASYYDGSTVVRWRWDIGSDNKTVTLSTGSLGINSNAGLLRVARLALS